MRITSSLRRGVGERGLNTGCGNEPKQHFGLNDVVVDVASITAGRVAARVSAGTRLGIKPAKPVIFLCCVVVVTGMTFLNGCIVWQSLDCCSEPLDAVFAH